MTDDPDDSPPELLDIWRQLDESRRASLLRVARSLAEVPPEKEKVGIDAGGHGGRIAIVPSQVRAARGLLGWSRDRLSRECGVPMRTLARFEGKAATPHASTLAAIRAALEGAGVIFVGENGNGPGVRLRKGR